MSEEDNKPENNVSMSWYNDEGKLKIWLSFIKWLVGSVAIVLAGMFIENGFKERSEGIQEMQAFDKYVDIILKADNTEERWKLAEFFSTVTPTDRLRSRWINYRNIVGPEYATFKKLKADEALLILKIQTNKTVESLDKLNKIKQQLQPYEKSLSSNQSSTSQTTKLIPSNLLQPNTSSAIPSISTENKSIAEIEKTVNDFKENLKKDSATDTRYQLTDYFNKIDKVNNAVVNGLAGEIGNLVGILQTNYNPDYKNSTFGNQIGLINKFDGSKKIIPKLAASFKEGKMILTMSGVGETETFTSSMNSIDWEAVRSFIKVYFVNRLEMLK